jgi:uncharacterized protein YcaQ
MRIPAVGIGSLQSAVAMPVSLQDLRRFAVARSLFPPTTLAQAMERMGFVQADPIRAPARAQDLILRHRVKGYRAGDLERRYPELGLEEDFFLTYGFVTRKVQALMHPRVETGVPADNPAPWPAARRRRARLLLDFVRARGEAHPRDVDRHFAHGTVRNYWGGSSSATTHLLDAMHYRGMLRVARREAGIRVYAARDLSSGSADPAQARTRLDALVDVAVGIYAPLPEASLRDFVRRLRFAVPQWRGDLKNALQRARDRLAHARVEGIDWYWPAGEDARAEPAGTIRLLTPFDPVTRDRDRFELLWGWVYRFEAYTPVRKRKLGYYALPLLWRDRVIGWGNVSVKNGRLESNVGFVHAPQGRRAFDRELGNELDRMREFLGLEAAR